MHFEYPLNDPPARDAISKLEVESSPEEIEASEKGRVEWAEELLVQLGLTPPTRQRSPKDSMAVHGDEDADILLHPTHPSPIFVLPHPSLPQLGSWSFSPAVLRKKMQDGESGVKILRDGNDELHIREVTTLAEAGPSSHSDVAQYLGKRRRETPTFPPTVQNLSLESSTTLEPPQPPDFHSLPKTTLLPSSSLPYTPRWTPLFNFETYWRELDATRKRTGRKSGVVRRDEVEGGERAALGDLLWYAETVTSTQTMLDRYAQGAMRSLCADPNSRNPLLLTSLPAPLAFLASFQLTGRGRGSNVWLSPPGCLQFSLLLTLPSSLSSKLVFIQYLMALAVCEAVDEDGRLGVRIKWPNDIYAEVEGVGGTEVGSGKKGKAKLGGILVNTNYIGNKWRIVVGKQLIIRA